MGRRNTHAGNLHVRQTYIECFIDFGEPNQSNISHNECAQIALITRQIPNAAERAVQLFFRQ